MSGLYQMSGYGFGLWLYKARTMSAWCAKRLLSAVLACCSLECNDGELIKNLQSVRFSKKNNAVTNEHCSTKEANVVACATSTECTTKGRQRESRQFCEQLLTNCKQLVPRPTRFGDFQMALVQYKFAVHPEEGSGFLLQNIGNPQLDNTAS